MGTACGLWCLERGTCRALLGPLRWGAYALMRPCPCAPARTQAQVEVHVSATVLSRQKGKPALRPHVHCVGQAADTDTEAASDWAGF